MNLESKLSMSLTKRAGHVVLRRELSGLGSPSNLSEAIRTLVEEGRLVRLASGVYAKASPDSRGRAQLPVSNESLLREAFAKLGVKVLGMTEHQENGRRTCWVDTGKRRVSRKFGWGNTKVRYRKDPLGVKKPKVPEDVDKLPVKGVAAFVARLAKVYGIAYRRSGLDDFAEAVTRAAGDDIKLDLTGKLLVALKRKGLINARQFARLISNYRKELSGVRSIRGLRDEGLSAKH